MARRSRAVRWLLALTILAGVGAVALAGFVYFAFLRDLPDLRTLADYRPPLSTHVLARDGTEIATFAEERRRRTPLEEVPQVVVQAFLAAEDDSFFQHSGVDYRSILRAAWANLRAGGEKRQGASTITQQTVKQLLLSPERTYRRKVRELILARRLEERFTKREILYLYLNQTYFGSGAYGVGEAADTYFGKPVGELNAGEAALLAGLPKAPSRFSPFRNPEFAEERRQYVLKRMREEDFVTGEAYDRYAQNPPTIAPRETEEIVEASGYFTEEVRRYLVSALGTERVLRGGLTVETTLDPELQLEAWRSLRTGLRELDHRQGFRGPIRAVREDHLAAERERLAKENGLAAEAESDEEAIYPRKGAEEEPGPFAEGPLLGVVVALDAPTDTARVAFSPELEGIVALDDVAWAHPVDLESWMRERDDIEEVFSVGDVAPFERRETEPLRTDDGELRVTLHQEPAVQGAVLSFEIDSGAVRALMGGYDFAASEFDRAVQARRQPGSAFKPIIYAAALGRDYTPGSILYDRPVVYDDPESGFTWRPENYGRKFLGRLVLSQALARSVNNATIHLLQEVGVGYVVDFARHLGIEAPLDRNLSLALGSSSVSLLELTRAYAVFPNGGSRVTPYLIERVLDRSGDVLLENVTLDATAPGEDDAEEEIPEPTPRSRFASGNGDRPPPDRLLPRTQAYLATDLLRGVVEHPNGTGRRAQALGRPVAGKTGTTNDQGDAWFVGFSPEVATGVWVGFDEKQVLGHGETGGRAALPIWMRYMKAALADRPVRDFDAPDDIVFARIDAETGLLASGQSERAFLQAFEKGTEPTRQADGSRASTEEERELRLDF